MISAIVLRNFLLSQTKFEKNRLLPHTVNCLSFADYIREQDEQKSWKICSLNLIIRYDKVYSFKVQR